MEKMSIRKLIMVHLDDYIDIVSQIFKALKDSDSNLVKEMIGLLGEKNEHLQNVINRLIRHQKAEAEIRKLQNDVENLDKIIVDFATKLGDYEQLLHEVTTDDHTLRKWDGEITKQQFSVDQLNVLSSRLSLMSSAPADFDESSGSVLILPPAPQEDLRSRSLLHLTTDQLVELAQAEAIDTIEEDETTLDTVPFESNIISFKAGDVITEDYLREVRKDVSQTNAAPTVKTNIALRLDDSSSSSSSELEDEAPFADD